MGVYQVLFRVPLTPPSLNDMLRTHWSKRAKEQERWDLHVFAQWFQSGKFVFPRPVRITYTIRWPESRQRDIDNYIGGTKYLTDAIKRTFLTRDDSEWLQEIGIKFDKGPAETLVNIQEV
jgi:Holliday junction resolvase RusA-like endonuclease